MRFYLISDNIDTLVGLRLAGIRGEITHTAGETLDAFSRVFADTEIAIVLVTKKLYDLCGGYIEEQRRARPAPLITVIPDRHGSEIKEGQGA